VPSIPLGPERVGTWLDLREQRVWRQCLDVVARMPVALARGLREDGDLSLADFDVLVRLSERSEARLQVAELAELLLWDRAGADRQVVAMQAAGLVLLEDPAPEDDVAGGSWVALTGPGRAAIEAAAPAHVGLVRYLLFDALDEADVEVLERITALVARGLDDLGVPPAG
jgi:DNA-binding MarR family transcriptional regulator